MLTATKNMTIFHDGPAGRSTGFTKGTGLRYRLMAEYPTLGPTEKKSYHLFVGTGMYDFLHR